MIHSTTFILSQKLIGYDISMFVDVILAVSMCALLYTACFTLFDATHSRSLINTAQYYHQLAATRVQESVIRWKMVSEGNLSNIEQ